MMTFKVIPMTLREANDFVAQFHRHNRPVQGHRFSIGASDGGELWGVAIVGRPLSRMLQDGYTSEVLRTCVRPGAPKNANSFLYGRCWRVWQAMGGRRLVTYTLATESGSSLRGAGWKIAGEVKPAGPKGWSSAGREREWQPIYGQQKFRWEKESSSPC